MNQSSLVNVSVFSSRTATTSDVMMIIMIDRRQQQGKDDAFNDTSSQLHVHSVALKAEGTEYSPD